MTIIQILVLSFSVKTDQCGKITTWVKLKWNSARVHFISVFPPWPHALCERLQLFNIQQLRLTSVITAEMKAHTSSSALWLGRDDPHLFHWQHNGIITVQVLIYRKGRRLSAAVRRRPFIDYTTTERPLIPALNVSLLWTCRTSRSAIISEIRSLVKLKRVN